MNIKAEARPTLTTALPFEIHPQNAKHGILLIHGYTGSPYNMRYLAERLAQAGAGVSVPRLPGAGTEMEDLSVSSRRDWRRRVYDAWLDLRSRYETASVVGYSMGGILALDLAGRVKTEKLALIAPALYAVSPLVRCAPLIRPFARLIGEIPTNWQPKDEDDEKIREHGQRYWTRRDIHSVAQMALLAGETRRTVRKITVPTMAIISPRDKTVPTRVVDFLEKKLPRGLEMSLVMNRCGHDIPNGIQKVEVANAVVDWILK